MNALILVAAGSGSRMGGAARDKILLNVGGRPIAAYSIDACRKSGVIDYFAVVFRDESQRVELEKILDAARIPGDRRVWVAGGERRQDSVCNALESLPPEIRQVFIHDAARPLVRPETFRRLAQLVHETGAACVARRVTDTIKEAQSQAGDLPVQLRTVDRSRLWRTETPQAFETDRIREGHRQARQQGIELTDDAAALELLGQPVSLLEVSYLNSKLTTPADLPLFEFLLGAEMRKM